MSTVDGLIAPDALPEALSETHPPRRRRRRGGRGPRALWAAAAQPGSGGCSRSPRWSCTASSSLYPVITAIQYSFFDWDGINVATPVGLAELRPGVHRAAAAGLDPALVLPDHLLHVPAADHRPGRGLDRPRDRSKFVGAGARMLMFLPQIIPGAAAAIAWTWMYSPNGAVNQLLCAVGLARVDPRLARRLHLGAPRGRHHRHLAGDRPVHPAAAVRHRQDRRRLYEAASSTAPTASSSSRAITLPGLRREIGVCMTITIISALASFDVVFMSTQGGPGYSTMVPGVQVYQLAFTESRDRAGLRSGRRPQPPGPEWSSCPSSASSGRNDAPMLTRSKDTAPQDHP